MHHGGVLRSGPSASASDNSFPRVLSLLHELRVFGNLSACYIMRLLGDKILRIVFL